MRYTRHSRQKMRNRRRGMSLPELMVAIGIAAILVLIVVPAMVYYARTIKGIRMQQRMQQASNLFIQEMQVELTRANEVEYVSDNLVRIKSRENVLVEDDDTPGLYNYNVFPITLDLEYVDEDDDPETINDNYINYKWTKKNSEGTIVDEREDTYLFWVSPIVDEDGDTLPIFREDKATKSYVSMAVRVGDRNNPADDEDNRWTGPGYQGFVFETVLTPTN